MDRQASSLNLNTHRKFSKKSRKPSIYSMNLNEYMRVGHLLVFLYKIVKSLKLKLAGICFSSWTVSIYLNTFALHFDLCSVFTKREKYNWLEIKAPKGVFTPFFLQTAWNVRSRVARCWLKCAILALCRWPWRFPFSTKFCLKVDYNSLATFLALCCKRWRLSATKFWLLTHFCSLISKTFFVSVSATFLLFTLTFDEKFRVFLYDLIG